MSNSTLRVVKKKGLASTELRYIRRNYMLQDVLAQLKLVTDLLLYNCIELEATRNLLIGEYIRHKGEDVNELNDALRELRKVARTQLMAQIQNKYQMNDIEDLLKGL